MFKNMKIHWKRAVSGLLAAVMAVGMLPVSAFAADTSGASAAETAPIYSPTGSFELNVAGATAWNGSDKLMAVYKTESGTAQVTTIPTATPFALLEDKGGDRIKVGYVADRQQPGRYRLGGQGQRLGQSARCSPQHCLRPGRQQAV